jgi:hypothetical protein
MDAMDDPNRSCDLSWPDELVLLLLDGGFWTAVTWPGGGQLHGTDRDVGPSMNAVFVTIIDQKPSIDACRRHKQPLAVQQGSRIQLRYSW